MTSESFTRIQQRAYALWEGAGCPEGKEEEHWLAAEREVEEETRSGAGIPVSDEIPAQQGAGARSKRQLPKAGTRARSGGN